MTSTTCLFLSLLALSHPLFVASDDNPITITNQSTKKALSSLKYPSLVVGENDNSAHFAWMVTPDGRIMAHDNATTEGKRACVTVKEDQRWAVLAPCQAGLPGQTWFVTGNFIFSKERNQCLDNKFDQIVGMGDRCRYSPEEHWIVEPYVA